MSQIVVSAGGRRIRSLFDAMSPYTYAEWIRHNEPDDGELDRQRGDAAVHEGPVISFVTAVYNPPPDVLRDTIESVLAQTCPGWELCLVDGGSTVPEVRRILLDHQARDTRVRVRMLGENRGISGNLNEALKLASGDFVALLDHDDLVAPHMVFQVLALLRGEPELDVVFFDEDKVTADGRTRLAPWFKPRFQHDILLSTNLLMHAVFRRSLVERVGGFDPEMDGAQDWDLAFRVARATDRVAHAAGVLYHWRQVPGSVAGDVAAKPWAFEAQMRAVRAAVACMPDTEGAEVGFEGPGCVRVRWPVSGKLVSIVIPTRDHRELLERCISSLVARTRYANYEIVIVDNGSRDQDVRDYYAGLEADARIRVVPFDEPFNYSRANNLGVRHARGDLVLFLNNDIEVTDPDWLDELVGWVERPGVGVVGAKLVRPDGTLQHAGIIMGLLGHGSHVFDGGPEHQYGPFGSTDWYRECSAVTGACLMTTRFVLDEVGGFDEVYTLGFSDIEFCLRVGAGGRRVVYTPFARLVHAEGGSRGLSLPPSDLVRATWQLLPRIVPEDPFFNGNLSYQTRVPELRRPLEEERDERLLTILRDRGLAIRTTSPTLDGWSGSAPIPRPWPSATGGAGPDGDRVASGDAGTRRALLFTHDLSLSGAPRVMCLLGRRLRTEGHAVRVVSPVDGPLRELYDEAGVEVCIEPHVLDDVRAAVRHLGLEWDLALVNTILSWRVVHAARAFGRPVIWWLHESGYGSDLVRDNPDVAAALATADRVLCPARATAQLYGPWLVRNQGILCPYGLDPTELEPARAEVAPPAGARFPVRVVHVGSIEPRKGQDVLIEAVRGLPDELSSRCDVRFLGRVLDPLYALAVKRRAEGNPNIHFLGEAGHGVVMEQLAAADVFVLSSRDEVLPLTILEAMYHGRAIIGTDVGGVGEMVVHGETGLLVPSGDVPALRQALVRLAEDRALCRRLGEAARQAFLSRYTMDHFRANLNVVFEAVSGLRWRTIRREPPTGVGDECPWWRSR